MLNNQKDVQKQRKIRYCAFIALNSIKCTEDIPAPKGGKSPKPKETNRITHDLTGPEDFVAIYETLLLSTHI